MRVSGIVSQEPLDASDNHIQGDCVVPTFGDDHICIALGRLYKFEMHRANRVHVLLDHGLGRAAALRDVPIQAADKSQVRIGVDENFYIEEFSQVGFREDKDALHDDDIVGFYWDKLVGAGVSFEIVDRQFDSLPIF